MAWCRWHEPRPCGTDWQARCRYARPAAPRSRRRVCADEGGLARRRARRERPTLRSSPHMAISEQRYFRRGSQGTAVMLHGEVRDLMMAPREGALELTIQA